MFDQRGQWNSSRESVTNSTYKLKVFVTLMFSVKISPFSFKTIFDSQFVVEFEKYFPIVKREICPNTKDT